MNRQEILQALTKPRFKEIAVNIAGEDADDLYQHLWLLFHDMKDALLEKQNIQNEFQLKNVYCRIAKLQYTSDTSSFHWLYRRVNDFREHKGSQFKYHQKQLDIRDPVANMKVPDHLKDFYEYAETELKKDVKKPVAHIQVTQTSLF